MVGQELVGKERAIVERAIVADRAMEFVRRAAEHYRARLAEEKERFGVLGISTTFIDCHSSEVVEHEHAGLLWKELSEQSGLFLTVDYLHDDAQVVYAILSKEVVVRPQQLVDLDLLVGGLVLGVALWEMMGNLENYEGPYKLSIPDDLRGFHQLQL